MTTVLVVDDFAVDRRLVGGLLEKDAGLKVTYAVDGVEALATMERELPDLVVTDLIMPEMDGLELVANVRSTYPQVPVILMTSKGSEEIAVQALQAGAASYVPKRILATKLLDTVEGVLAIARRQRSHSRLMACMTKHEYSFVLDNDRTLTGPLVTYLQDGIISMGICDEPESMRVGIALEEALANALYHGNLEIDSTLREEDTCAYFAMVERRAARSPYAERRTHVDATLQRDRAVFVVRDEGSGFDPSALPDPTDPTNLERASGRGVLLMRTFMDEVIYNEVGNAVTLIKYGKRKR